MGIPGLFGFLSRKYKKVNLVEKFDYRKEDFDNFFIDYNGLIHKVINDLQEIKKDKDIFNEILNYTLEVSKLVNPKKRLVIAVDGVAPRAKMNQQRMRRFKSALNGSQSFFDRNKVTPGTEFMDNLDNFLKKNIYKKIKNIEIIYSGVNERGEGEHKIMEYIRENHSELKDDKNCLLGLDADLIMLTSITNLEFKLLREEKLPGAFSVFDVEMFKDLLLKDVESRTQTRMSKKRFIKDFILLSFFIGNDFIPNLPLIKIRKNGINILLNNYSRLFKKTGDYLVNENNSIHEFRFNQFIRTMSSGELYELGKNNASEFKKEYYSHFFHSYSKEFIKFVTKEYCKGLDWILEYYLNGVKDWDWYYPFYYSPFVSDFSVYKNIIFERTDSLTPEQQLVCVLPEKSLPEKFRLKMNDDIRYMFPVKFKIDDSDENIPGHARVALIPFVETDILFKTFFGTRLKQN